MKNLIGEAFILGTLIYFGLSNIDINVTINVTDKPIITRAAGEAE